MDEDSPIAHRAAATEPGGGGAGGLNSYLLCGTRFELTPRYTPVKPIGHGAYGVVVSAQDSTTNRPVAIKKIGKTFENLKDTKRILREIKLLRHFNHENVLSITDILPPRSKADFNDVYIVTELMDTDLQQIIASNQKLTDEHCQYFVYQMLRGLKAIHSAHVLHRDLKPSNLLCNGDCLLKICDFGLARVANTDDNWNGFLTEYVATRWYRAPEVILSWKQYTKAIDMWSCGCIFAELLGRKPLFQGKDYINQITKITDILGTPPEDEIEAIRCEPARRYIRQMGYKPKVPFSQLFRSSPAAIDLLERMLAFDPSKRCTVEEALEHPYLASLHDPDDEPTASSEFNFDEFEEKELDKSAFQDLIAREMFHFHPEARAYF